MTRELAVNKALAGNELKMVLRDAMERLLDAEGLLSNHIAYGRVAYEVILRLHVANAIRPTSETKIESRPIGVNIVEKGMPELRAIEPAPLTPPLDDDATVSGTTLTGNVTSPNAERVRLGIPVPVQRRQQDGTLATELIKYPPQPDIAPADIRISDSTGEARAAWNLPPTPPIESETAEAGNGADDGVNS